MSSADGTHDGLGLPRHEVPQPSGSAPGLPPVDRSARPLDVDGTTSVAIGTALWAVAGAVLFVFYRERLTAADADWWLWTCLAGFGLGCVGWAHCRRRRDRHRLGRRPGESVS